MTVIGTAGLFLYMGDKLAAFGVADRGRDGDLDAELVGLVSPTFDAFYLRCVRE